MGTFCVADTRPREWSDDDLRTARDLAAMAAAELRLRHEAAAVRVRDRAIAAARDGILIADASQPDLPVVFVNPAFQALTGYRADEVLGRNCRFLQGPGSDPAAVERMREAIRAGTPVRVELVNYRKDGTPFWVEISITPVRDEAGRVVQFVGVQKDITERVRAAEALRQREEYFRALLENSDDVIDVLEADGTIRYMTPSVERVLGYRPEDMVGRSSFDFLHPDQHEAVRAAFAGVAAEPGPGPVVVLPMLHRDGTLRFMEAQATNLLHDPAVRGIVVNSRDITARRAATEELRDREALLRSVLEGIPDPIYLKDVEGRYLLVNSAACTALRMTPDQVVGRTDRELFPRMWPEPGDNDERVLRSGAGVTYEEQVPLAGGQVTYLTHKSPRLDAHGRVAGIVGISRDITDRRVAEQELRQQKEILQTVLDSIPLMIGFFDARARFFYVNRHWERVLGWSVAEMDGRDVLADLFTDAAARDMLADFMLRAPEGWMDTRVRVAAGGVVDTSWAAVRLPDGTSIAIGQDVSARKRAEAALRDREEQLRAAQKMEAVGRLAGGVAHDFNNLLMVVGGHAQFLLRGAPDDYPGRWSLEEIRKATERAASLTQQLLAFSRRQVLNPQVLDPNSVVQGVASMLEKLVGENVEMVTRLAPDVGRVRADATQMEQVLMNLAVNARDAMPEGGVLVIETRNEVLTADDTRQYPYVVPGPHVLLSVTDSGQGMDAETVERAFEPFFTTKPAGKGTGLGLSTVYGIVKQSGGYVWVRSTRGVATTFSVYLPRVDALLTPPAPTAAPERFTGGSGTVLLVEDTDPVRVLAARVLADAGYTVLAAAGGAQALELARGADIDLLLTDVAMPGMDGTELARRLRVERPDLRVVYMSGYTGEEVDRRATLEAGATFLQKPVAPDHLVRAMREAMEGRP